MATNQRELVFHAEVLALRRRTRRIYMVFSPDENMRRVAAKLAVFGNVDVFGHALCMDCTDDQRLELAWLSVNAMSNKPQEMP